MRCRRCRCGQWDLEDEGSSPAALALASTRPRGGRQPHQDRHRYHIFILSKKDFKGYFGFPGSQPGGTSFRYSSNGIPVWDEPVAIVNQAHLQVVLAACTGPETAKAGEHGLLKASTATRERSGLLGTQPKSKKIGSAQDPVLQPAKIGPAQDPALQPENTKASKMRSKGLAQSREQAASEVLVQEDQIVVQGVAPQQPPNAAAKAQDRSARRSKTRSLKMKFTSSYCVSKDRSGRMEPIGAPLPN